MKKVEFWEERLIYKTYAGSYSYGTTTEDSDEDFRGVCIPPENYLLGLDVFEQKEYKEFDMIIYSLEKLVRLALQNNPNIIDILFVEPSHIIYIDELGEELRKLRYDFLSKKIYKTYGGFAYSQLKKMVSVDKNAKGKRIEYIQKYGYDTKNAMHLIRLMNMAIEVLMEGELNVFRHDNEYLLDIRKGKYTKEEIESEYKRLKQLLDQAYVKSILPDKPNYEKVNNWLVSAHKRCLDYRIA